MSFPFQVGDDTGFYHRIMKMRLRGPDVDLPGRNDVATVSSEGKRQRVIDETKAAVLVHIRRDG